MIHEKGLCKVLSAAYKEERLENGETRTVLNIPAAIAPVKAAIFPLVKKDGLPEVARELMHALKADHNVQYDEKDSIGKRYRRQDAIGTPFCVTYDFESAEDGCVTVRHRDSMEQVRVRMDELESYIASRITF